MTAGPSRVVLTSRWQLDAPVHRLWPLLAQVDRWPHWWPGARAAGSALRAPASPLGDVARLSLRGALPIEMRLQLTTIAVEDARMLEWHAAGDLQAVVAWILEPGRGRGVDITCRWDLAPASPGWRGLAMLSRRVLEWNHFALMRSGARGLGEALDAETSAVSEWAGTRRP